MAEHTLKRNIDDDKACLWFTCSCGWTGPRHDLGAKPYSAMTEALAEAKQHFAGGLTP